MVRLLSTLAIALCAAVASATVNTTGITLPATVEFDLVFPRNNTVYAPSSVFPIVFAFQNTRLAAALNAALDVHFWTGDGNNSSGTIGINLRYANYTNGSDPLFVYASTRYFENITTATPITLEWSFSAPNCTYTTDQGSGAGGVLVNKRISFTVEKGAQSPDLVNSTANDGGCANIERAVYNISAVESIALPDNYINYHSGSCAKYTDLSSTPTAGNPCVVQVGTAVAASISAAMTAAVCNTLGEVPIDCSSYKKNGAPRISMMGGNGVAIVAGITAAILAWEFL